MYTDPNSNIHFDYKIINLFRFYFIEPRFELIAKKFKRQIRQNMIFLVLLKSYKNIFYSNLYQLRNKVQDIAYHELSVLHHSPSVNESITI